MIKISNLEFLFLLLFKWMFFFVDMILYIFLIYLNEFITPKFNFLIGIKVFTRWFFMQKSKKNDIIAFDFIMPLFKESVSLTSLAALASCNIYDFLQKDFSVFINVFLNQILTRQYKTSYINVLQILKSGLRQQQTFFGFYQIFKNMSKMTVSIEMFWRQAYFGVTAVIKHIRLWLIPLIVGITIIYYSVLIRILPFNKIIFLWLAIIMVGYWLISGFVFFFKKYQYGKYTSAVQRFWRRSYILFWLLESSLLLVFVYLTFIASQESFYMFDQIQFYKNHLFSWRIFFVKIFPLVLLIMLAYFFLLSIKWNIFSKLSSWLLFFTITLTYIVWLEFYQFFHIVNFYGNLVWNYDMDEKMWLLELETRRTRIVNHYVMWLLILKFWHLLFVYIFWLFFVLRGVEKNSIRYPLFSANHQNLIILFIMSWLYMFPWFKLYFRKFLDMPYFWFYLNNRNFFIREFFVDLKVLWYGLLEVILQNSRITSFKYIPFIYWFQTNKYFVFNLAPKHIIRNQIIEMLSYNVFPNKGDF